MLRSARFAWTTAAFQEHRTGAACATALRALIEARAPLDLIALAARFPLDEMVHVELCARMAMALGGGTEIRHDPNALFADANPAFSPLIRATELVIRIFCVGEAISIPLLRGTMKASKHPLPRAVLGRIVHREDYCFFAVFPNRSSTIVSATRYVGVCVRALRSAISKIVS